MKTSLLLTAASLLLLGCDAASPETSLQAEIAAANYCETENDCVLIGSKCPFDCYIYVNGNEAEELRAKVDAFPSDCVYSCLQSFGVACEQNTCVAITMDPSMENGDEEQSSSIDDGIDIPDEEPEVTEEMQYCETDGDCVGATCCHPDEVVNREFAPDCSAVLCTMECSGPLDCGYNRPACVNNLCTIVPADEE